MVCGKRNNRGLNPDGSLVKLDNYDKMVLQSKEI